MGTISIPTDYPFSTWSQTVFSESTLIESSITGPSSLPTTMQTEWNSVTGGGQIQPFKISNPKGTLSATKARIYTTNSSVWGCKIINTLPLGTPDPTSVVATYTSVDTVVIDPSWAYQDFSFGVTKLENGTLYAIAPYLTSSYVGLAWPVDSTTYTQKGWYDSSGVLTQDTGSYWFTLYGGYVETMTSPAMDAGSGNAWDKVAITGADLQGMTIEVRCATTSAGLSSATYFEARNDCVFPLSQQKRYMQVKITFLSSSYSTIDSIVMSYEVAPQLTQTEGLNYSGKGARPSWDHEFQGRLYQCAVCGGTYRRNEMTMQRGGLVCKITCKDLRKSAPSPIQIRSK